MSTQIRTIMLNGIRQSLNQLRCARDSHQTISISYGAAMAWQMAAQRLSSISHEEYERLDELAANAVQHARREVRHA